MAKISSLSSLSKKPQKLGLGRDLEAPPSQGGTHLQAPGACCVGRTLIRQRGNQSHHDGTAGKFFFSSEFQSALLCRGPGSASGVTQREPRLPSTPASRLKHTPSPPRFPAGVACSPDPSPSCLAPSWPHYHEDAAPRTDRKCPMRPHRRCGDHATDHPRLRGAAGCPACRPGLRVCAKLHIPGKEAQRLLKGLLARRN